MKIRHLATIYLPLLSIASLGTWLAIAGVVAPNIEVELTDSLGEESQPDGNANLNETIKLTASVTNLEPFAIPDAVYDTTIDPKTTLVPGSVKISPYAMNETYAAIGNVGIVVPAADGVLENDVDPDGTGNPLADLQAGPSNIPTTAGGAVTMSPDGGFTYTPAAGFQGPDTFTYDIADADGLSDASTGSGIVTVTINVSGMIWFFDDSNTVAGDGRRGNPFKTLAQHNSNPNDNDGDCLYIFAGTYTDGLSLQNSQRVYGQGATQSLATFCALTIPPHTPTQPSFGPRPVLEVPSGNAITLGADNQLIGLNLGNGTGTGLVGSNFGTAAISDMAINTSGRAISLNTGILNAAFDSITKTSSGSDAITMLNTGGAIDLGACNLTSSGNGGALIFAGLGPAASTISWDAGATFQTASGAAVNIQSTTLGATAAGVSVRSITSNGDGTEPAIQLLSTAGNFTVTGTGTTLGSGGSITNKVDDDAIRLSNTSGLITFQNFDINQINGSNDVAVSTTYQSGADAIHGEDLLGGLRLDRVRIDHISDCALNLAPIISPTTYTERTTIVGLEITNSTITDTNRFHIAGNNGDDFRSVFRESLIRAHGISGQVTLDNNFFKDGSGLAQFITADTGTVRFDITRNLFHQSIKELTTAEVNVGGAGLEVYVAGSTSADIIIGDLANTNPALGNQFLNCGKGDYGSMNIRTAPNAPAFSGDLDVHVARNSFEVNDHFTDAFATQGSGVLYNGFPQGEVEMIIGGAGSTVEALFTDNTFDGCQGDNANFRGSSLNLTTFPGTVGQTIVQNNTYREVWGHISRTEADASQHFHHFISNNIINDATAGNAAGTDVAQAGLGNTQEFPYESIICNVRNTGEIHFTKRNQNIADHDTAFNFGSDQSIEFANASPTDQLFIDFDNGFAHNGFEFDNGAGGLIQLYRDGSGAGTVDGVIDAQGTNRNGAASNTNGTITLGNTNPTDPTVVVP